MPASYGSFETLSIVRALFYADVLLIPGLADRRNTSAQAKINVERVLKTVKMTEKDQLQLTPVQYYISIKPD